MMIMMIMLNHHDNGDDLYRWKRWVKDSYRAHNITKEARQIGPAEACLLLICGPCFRLRTNASYRITNYRPPLVRQLQYGDHVIVNKCRNSQKSVTGLPKETWTGKSLNRRRGAFANCFRYSDHTRRSLASVTIGSVISMKAIRRRLTINNL